MQDVFRRAVAAHVSIAYRAVRRLKHVHKTLRNGVQMLLVRAQGVGEVGCARSAWQAPAKALAQHGAVCSCACSWSILRKTYD